MLRELSKAPKSRAQEEKKFEHENDALKLELERRKHEYKRQLESALKKKDYDCKEKDAACDRELSIRNDMFSSLKRRYHILQMRMASCDRELEQEIKKQYDLKQRELAAVDVKNLRKKENTKLTT